MIYHSYIERCECMLKSVGQYILGCNNGQHIKIKSFINRDHPKLTS